MLRIKHPFRIHLGICAVLMCSLAALPVLRTSSAGQGTTQADNGKEFSLQRAFKAGEKDRYKLDFKTAVVLNGKKLDVNVLMTIIETTQEVKSDGTVLLIDKAEEASVKLGASALDDATAMVPKVTQTLDKQGRLVGLKLEDANGPFADEGQEMIQQMLLART